MKLLSQKVKRDSLILLSIPLILSAFTHLLNPIGFPAQHWDENVYIGKALQVSEGKGLQDEFLHYYNPYFGQIFLGTIFKIINYPHLLNPSFDLNSIEQLHAVPRIIVGILAVIDTFFVYQISNRLYNRNVALISSVLFAVMPSTWLLRFVFLESLLLPFLLTSILLAVSITLKKGDFFGKYDKNTISLVLLSGVFLGLAIFTKISAFCLIPMIGFIIYKKTSSLKILGVWFIPIILIPLIWPLHAYSLGDFQVWVDDIIHQSTERDESGIDLESHTLFGGFKTLLSIDPFILIIGLISLSFVTIVKKDILYVLWILPTIFFFYIINYFSIHFFIPLLPAFWIASGISLGYLFELTKKINLKRKKPYFPKLFFSLPFILTISIASFGFISTILLVTTDVAYFQYHAAAYVAKLLVANGIDSNQNNINKINSNMNIASYSMFYWLFKNMFGVNNTYHYKHMSEVKILSSKGLSENLIIIGDEDFEKGIGLNRNFQDKLTYVNDSNYKTRWNSKGIGSWLEVDLGKPKTICSIDISWYKGNERFYDFMIANSSDGKSYNTVYYGKSKVNTASENYVLDNTLSRFIKIVVNGNSVNDYASINELKLYGRDVNESDSVCKNLIIHELNTSNNENLLEKKVTKKNQIMQLLYNSTHIKKTFLGSADSYNKKVYPYNGLEHLDGGSKVDVYTNFVP